MPALKTSLCILSLVLAALPIAHAKTNYAYVANNSAGTVSVVNTASNTVTATIPVGSFPYAVAVNQAGTFAYVTNSGSGTVSVINTTSNTVVATVTVGGSPLNITLSPSGKTAYVSTGSSVAVINTGTKKVTANITVSNPIGLAVTPNGAFLYVVDSSAGNVLCVSTLTNAVVATIAVGTNIPVALAISPDGTTAYVTSYNSATVSVIRTGDNALVNTINVSAGPFSEAISPDGHWLYVSNYNAGGGNLVTVIDTKTQTVSTSIVVGTGPLQISFTQDGAFAYVANITTNNVSLINTQSRTVVNTITVGKAPTGVGVMGTMKVSTVAGGYVGDKGLATNAAIGGAYSSVYDGAGNLFISDFFGHRIRRVDQATQHITTYAGNGICGYNGENVKSTKAMVCYPNGLAIDAAGNLIAAGGNGRIQKFDRASSKVTTIAGTGAFGYTGNGGPALDAQIGQPYSLTYDAAGNLYFSQIEHCVVRKIDTAGTISAVAGNGTCGYGGDGGPATSAMMNFTRGVAVDSSGNVYIADSQNHRVRKVSGGVITTFAGNGSQGFSGDGGLATNAKVGNPVGLAIRSGLLYITNAGASRVRTVDLSTNIIQSYAGSSFGYDGDGHTLLATRFTGPRGIHFDSAGNPVFDDAFNGRVRKVTSGIVNTVAGGYLGDGGKAISAALVLPEALAVDKSGAIYIADWTGNRVRKVSAGKMSTVAGTGINDYSGDGGPGTSAMLNGPFGVTTDSSGNVLIADTANGVIRKVDTAGTITTFASDPNFNDLLQMATDSANNIYVADDGACVVWKITAGGVVSIAAGVLNACGYNGDAMLATSAELNIPDGVAVDSSGNLFISDFGNNRVRQVAGGVINTIAGDGTCDYVGDGGPATSAELCPNSVAVAKSGTIYVADNFTRIRKIAGGTITTFAGAGIGFNGDKFWPLLTLFDDIVAVAVDSKGTVYALDDVERRVREIK